MPGLNGSVLGGNQQAGSCANADPATGVRSAANNAALRRLRFGEIVFRTDMLESPNLNSIERRVD